MLIKCGTSQITACKKVLGIRNLHVINIFKFCLNKVIEEMAFKQSWNQ